MEWTEIDRESMDRALQLAERGRGRVEPNPLVGCVIVRDGQRVGEGWHEVFGGPHAEVVALRQAGEAARGATLYVTLEPCSHFGKTPPCVAAILAAGIRRVVLAEQDPFPQVAGRGVAQLRGAGLTVDIGLFENQAHSLNAPYHTLLTAGRPFVLAKWAMTADGKIATRTGDSRWISNARSREVVHQIRGRVDAVLVGRGTVAADDPLLTARPPGPRVPVRIVLDGQARLALESQLVQTARETPLLIVTGEDAPESSCRRLQDAGCEVLPVPGSSWPERLPQLLAELGRRRWTNLLVEGGSQTLGGFLDAERIDEFHIFISPRVLGGRTAPGPVGGEGPAILSAACQLAQPTWQELDGDLYLSGRCRRRGSADSP